MWRKKATSEQEERSPPAASAVSQDRPVPKPSDFNIFQHEHLPVVGSHARAVLGDPQMLVSMTNLGVKAEQILDLNHTASDALRNEGVRELIESGKLTIEQVLSLTDQAWYILRDPGMHELMGKWGLTAEQILGLTPTASAALQAWAHNLLQPDFLRDMTVKTALGLNIEIPRPSGDMLALNASSVLPTDEKVQLITEAIIVALKDPQVRELISNETLSEEQELGIRKATMFAWWASGLTELMNAKILLEQHVQLLMETAKVGLGVVLLCDLIDSDILLRQQVLDLNPATSSALLDTGVRKRITGGDHEYTAEEMNVLVLLLTNVKSANLALQKHDQDSHRLSNSSQALSQSGLFTPSSARSLSQLSVKDESTESDAKPAAYRQK